MGDRKETVGKGKQRRAKGEKQRTMLWGETERRNKSEKRGKRLHNSHNST